MNENLVNQPLFRKILERQSNLSDDKDKEDEKEEYKNLEIYYIKNVLEGIDSRNILAEMKEINPFDARAYETGRDENYLRSRLSQLTEEKIPETPQIVSKEETQALSEESEKENIEPVKNTEDLKNDKLIIGGMEFDNSQNVVVKRSNGDVENDWQVEGLRYFNGKKNISVKKEENGQVLIKEIPEDQFLSWQNPSKKAESESELEPKTENPNDISIDPNPTVAISQEVSDEAQNQVTLAEAQKQEWQEFEILRESLAQTEILLKNKKFVDESERMKFEDEFSQKRSFYEEQREKIAESIRIQTREELKLAPDAPIPDEAMVAMNDTIFNQLVVKEHKAYITALKAARGETLGDKTKEALKNALSNKAVQWYLRQNKWVKLGVTTLLITGVGYGVGTIVATGAVGYAGARFVRGAASFGGAAVGKIIGENKKSWSIEELEKKEKEKVESLRSSEKTLAEKSKEYAQINTESEKEKRNAKIKKTALTIGLGAGAGLLSGLSEHIFAGSGNSTSSTVENANASKVETETQTHTQTEAVEATKPDVIETTAEPEFKTPNQLEEEALTKAGLSESDAAPADVSIEKIFADESVLQHEVKAGDSVWKILEKTLDNNDRFKGLDNVAKKTYVLSALTNEVMQSPKDYNLEESGILQIGSRTDFTKLFENSKEVNAIFDKAEHLTLEQQSSILGNNQMIAEWVKDPQNIGKKLDEKAVSEILSSKPKTETVIESEYKTPNKIEEEILTQYGEVRQEPAIAPKPEPVQTIETLPKEIASETPDSNQDIPNQIPKTEIGGAEMAAGGVAMAAAPVVPIKSFKDGKREKLEGEIKAAQDRLNELERNHVAKNTGGSLKNPNLERSYASDKKIFYSERDFLERARKAFENETDRIYGQKGLFKNVKGVETNEWKEISRLPALNVVKYCTGDSQNSGLPTVAIEKLSKSEKHGEFLHQIIGLLEQTNGEIKPFENENTEQFFKRLGEFVLKKYMSGQKIAA